MRRAYFAWLIVCLVWGTTYLAIRVALETIPPGLIGGMRYTAAAIVLVSLLRVGRVALPSTSQWVGLAMTGCLMIGLGNGGVIWAQQWVPTGIAAVVVASTPFWMTAVEGLLPSGERLSRRITAGLLVGFSGIVLLVWPDLTLGGARGRQFAAGVAALQIACLGWALGSSYSRRHARDENPWGASAMQMLFGGLMLIAIGTVRGEWMQLSFSARSLVAELYLTVAGSLGGYTAYTYALQHLPVSTISLYAYVNPVIAVALGTLWLGEPFGWRVLAAAAMVFAGIGIVRIGGRKAE
jgi:drug/metabolite transporter (DMT)-like permease